MIESKKIVEKLLLKDLEVELPKELDPLMGVNDLSVGGGNDGQTPLYRAIMLAWNLNDWKLLNALIATRELENGCDLAVGFNLCNNNNTPILTIFDRIYGCAASDTDSNNNAFFKALRIFTKVPGIYTSLKGKDVPGRSPAKFQLPLTYLFGKNQQLTRLLEEKPLEAMADVLPCVNLAEKILISGLVPNYIEVAIDFLSRETKIFPHGISTLISEYLYDLVELNKCQNPVVSDQFSHNLFKLALICFMRDMGYEKQSLKEQQRQRLKELESQVQMHQKQIHLLEKQMEVVKQQLGDDPQSAAVTFSLTAQRTSQLYLGTTADDLETDSPTHQSKRKGLRFTSI